MQLIDLDLMTGVIKGIGEEFREGSPEKANSEMVIKLLNSKLCSEQLPAVVENDAERHFKECWEDVCKNHMTSDEMYNFGYSHGYQQALEDLMKFTGWKI